MPSAVALVKAEYPFDIALQDRAAQFLKNIEQMLRNKEGADKLVTDFVHSSVLLTQFLAFLKATSISLNSKLSFEDKSTIYNSLVTLVKAEYPFDNALQDRAAQFLKILEPKWGDFEEVDKFVTDLVPSSARSPSGFVNSILTLVSSPHSTVVVAALSLLRNVIALSSQLFLCRLDETNLISNVLATVQPHTLPVAGNETMFNRQVDIISFLANLALPRSLEELGITATVDTLNWPVKLCPGVRRLVKYYYVFTNKINEHIHLYLSNHERIIRRGSIRVAISIKTLLQREFKR
ncbi:hypothetical protein BLNAU_4911 [Blattamonas nauphoetae]|uniref:Uncharacterized protein n=1 Tax=Blattamonas nauphoetae TaxID=2049346 RepID=A0ABQ9Y8E1_9EUKA|nr:hypothetical protein BLNAU_4911 [Blattamonas nauphoetae]